MWPPKYGFGPMPTKGRMSYPYDSLFEEDEEEELYGGAIPTLQAQEPNITDAYQELLTRQPGPAMSAYSKFLEQGYPEEAKPSKLTRLGAILAGAASGVQGGVGHGLETSRSIIERPYEKSIRRYGLEGQRLATAASLEERGQGNKIQAVKSLRDAENQKRTSDRADILAKDLLKTRAITRQEAELRIKNAGLSIKDDENTGISYIVGLDGSMKPIGKFHPSTGEKLAQTKGTAKYTSDLAAGRARSQFTFEQPIRVKDQREAQERGFEQQKTMEALRQGNKEVLIDKRANIAAKRDALKLQNSNPNVISKLRGNYKRVQALVDANPTRYEDIWIADTDGTMMLAPDLFEGDENKKKARQELYDVYYKGFTPGITKQIGKYGVGGR